MNEKSMTLVGHLEELRQRLLFWLIAFAILTIISFHYSEVLFRWFAKPMGSLIFLAPAEAFIVRLKMACGVGFFLSLPILIFEAWKFAMAGLTQKEKKAIVWILPFSYGLFSTGCALALFIVLPATMKFLLSYGSEELRPFLSASAYFQFAFFMAIAFGLLFQLPLVLKVLAWAGVVTPFQLASQRRIIYLGSFIVAAVLTPGPDVFSQLILAVAVVVLFEISILLLRWSPSALSKSDQSKLSD